LTGLELNRRGDEDAEGLLDTMKEMYKAGELVLEDGLYSLPRNGSACWEGEDPIPTEEIAAACRGRPNMLVVIGYTGVKTCYFNTSAEDAIALYKAAEDTDDITGVHCEVISFHDMFGAYEVGP
jgi:hypothetical protein